MIETIRVRDDYSPQGFRVINRCDLNEFHDVWPDQAEDVVEAPAKRLVSGDVVMVDGLPGRFEVMIAHDAVSLEPLADDEPISMSLPSDWQGLHWKQQVKLAKEQGFNGEPTPQQAKEFLAERADTA